MTEREQRPCRAANPQDETFCLLAPDHAGAHMNRYGLVWSDRPKSYDCDRCGKAGATVERVQAGSHWWFHPECEFPTPATPRETR